MSLTALPVTVSDLTQLQQGIEFFTNTAEATAEAALINANTPGGPTVYSYAAQLLASNISLSQVAMADSALMEGTTIAVGNATTPNTLTLFSTVFLPGQVANAIAHGFNPTVYAAEALGLALGGNTAFNTNFVTPFATNISGFASAVSVATGVNVNAIQVFVQNWINFYTANPAATQGLTITQASFGAAFGDAVGVALLNPTSISPTNLPGALPAPPSGPPTFNTVQNEVYNALITNAEGTYKVGVPIGSLPLHTPLQGEGNNGTQGVFLTTGIDTPTSGFSLSPNGTPLLNGFTATQPGAIFNALPVVTALGAGVNTLNTGDNIQDTAAAADGTLNFTASVTSFGANPPFVTNLTMNGVSTLNATVDGGGGPGGFQGNITGLKVVNDTASLATLQLGGIGQGLNTALTNLNVTGFGAPNGSFIFAGVLAPGAVSAANTIKASFSGSNLGGTGAGLADSLAFSDDSGNPGTATAPNLTYGTYDLTFNSNANLQLVTTPFFGGPPLGTANVSGVTALVLSGKGNVALGQDFAANFQNITSIDATNESGKVILTGASAGNASHFLASAANPGWLFGSAAGILDDTGGTFKLASFKLGSGVNVLDASSATATQLAALTTTPNATAGTSNIIIVQDSVATTTSAATFANIAGFQTLGIGGPGVAQGAAGTIDMSKLPASINNITYMTTAKAAVTVNNGVSTLTVNVNHNSPQTGTTALAINRPTADTSLTDALTVTLGDAVGTVGGIAGANVSFVPVGAGGSAIDGLSAKGYEAVTINSNGTGPTAANVLSGVSLADVFNASPGGTETVTLAGTAPLFTNAFFVNGLGGTGVVNDNLTGTWDIWAFGNNVNPSTASGPNFIATNAAAINGANSGGIFMGGSDSFFNGLTGDILTGSSTASNTLAGSVSNDTFAGGGGGSKDFFITDNGGDTIALAAGHAADTVDLFFGNFAGNGGGFNGTVVGTFNNVKGLANSYISANDVADAGTWGVAPAVNANGTPAPNTAGSTPFQLFAHTNINNSGTSADMTVVNGFVSTTDAVQFSVSSNSQAGLGNGWVHIGAGTFMNLAGEATVLSVVPSGSAVPGTANVVGITGEVFANASALAFALGNAAGGGTYHLDIAAPGILHNHFLAAYADTSGNLRLADVDVTGFSGHMFNDQVVASDMVQLTGVSLANLQATPTMIHWIA